MKALVITPKDKDEYKFIDNLLKKLGIGSAALSEEEIEDLGLAKMMRGVDKSKKANHSEIIKKLSA